MYRITTSGDHYNYGKELKRMAKKRNMLIRQKLIGLAIIVGSIASIPVLDMDGTPAAFFVPVGLLLIISKEIFIGF